MYVIRLKVKLKLSSFIPEEASGDSFSMMHQKRVPHKKVKDY